MNRGELRTMMIDKYNLTITNRQLDVFVREYNDFKMSINDRLKDIKNNPDDFYNFVLEHTEIPLF